MTKTNFYNPLHHHPDSPDCFEYGHRCDENQALYDEAERDVERVHAEVLKDLIENDPDGHIRSIKESINDMLEQIPQKVEDTVHCELGAPSELDGEDVYKMALIYRDDLIYAIRDAVDGYLCSKTVGHLTLTLTI